MSRTREHLLGYLLGALEPAEMAEVERDLEKDPQLRKDLAAIEAALAPLGFPERDDDVSFDPPPADLGARTCEFVEDAKRDLVPRPMPAKVVAGSMSPEHERSVGRRFNWADVVVTASVLLAAVALLFPAIWTSRHSAQIAACQSNLRHVGLALAEFAGRAPDRRIPAVPTRGNRSTAGIYAAILQDQGLLPYPGMLVCPSSELAEQAATFRVPSLEEFDRAEGEVLVRLHSKAGGSYGYNLGFVENGRHTSPRHEGRSHYALMSDAPATFRPTRKTKNHFGCGQNILYEDNHVKFVADITDDLADDPYLNRNGLIAAGLDCWDVVLGESLAKPSVAH